MDPEVNPCEDFYRFSCGRFPLVNPRPSELASWTQFGMVSSRMRVQMTSDLLSTEPADLNGAAGSVRKVFQHCTNMSELKEGGEKVI